MPSWQRLLAALCLPAAAQQQAAPALPPEALDFLLGLPVEPCDRVFMDCPLSREPPWLWSCAGLRVRGAAAAAAGVSWTALRATLGRAVFLERSAGYDAASHLWLQVAATAIPVVAEYPLADLQELMRQLDIFSRNIVINGIGSAFKLISKSSMNSALRVWYGHPLDDLDRGDICLPGILAAHFSILRTCNNATGLQCGTTPRKLRFSKMVLERFLTDKSLLMTDVTWILDSMGWPLKLLDYLALLDALDSPAQPLHLRELFLRVERAQAAHPGPGPLRPPVEPQSPVAKEARRGLRVNILGIHSVGFELYAAAERAFAEPEVRMFGFRPERRRPEDLELCANFTCEVQESFDSLLFELTEVPPFKVGSGRLVTVGPTGLSKLDQQLAQRGGRALDADFFMCTYPMVLCLALHKVVGTKPLTSFAYHWIEYVVPEEQPVATARVAAIMNQPENRLLFVVNSFQAVHYAIAWKLNITYVPYTGSYLYRYLNISDPWARRPNAKGPVVFSRTQTLINPQVMGLTQRFLDQVAHAHGVSHDVVFGKFEYTDLLKYRAVVLVPWSWNLVSSTEYYALGIPTFFPAKGLMVALVWLHLQLRPWRFHDLRTDWAPPSGCGHSFVSDADHERRLGLEPGAVLPHCAQRLEDVSVWWDYTDYTTTPHLQRYGSYADLFLQLASLDLDAVSARMLAEQRRRLEWQESFFQQAWLGLRLAS